MSKKARALVVRRPRRATGNPDSLLQRAIQHHQAGCLTAAEQLYRTILQEHPHHFDALHLLGVVAIQQGEQTLAMELMQQALRLRPQHAEAWYNLGKALHDARRPQEAIAAYQRALAIQPQYIQAANNLGLALIDTRQFVEALELYRDLAKHYEASAYIYNNLGLAYYKLKRFDEAILAFNQALAVDATLADAYANLGVIFHEQKRLEDAMLINLQGLHYAPDNRKMWTNLLTMVYSAALPVAFVARHLRRQDLQALLSLEAFDFKLFSLVYQWLLQEHQVVLRETVPSIPHTAQGKGAAVRDILLQVVQDPLFLLLLEHEVLAESQLEATLVEVRQALLVTVVEQRHIEATDSNFLAFLCALGWQCFFNEYIYAESAAESALLQHMITWIHMALASHAPLKKDLVAILATYRPLYTLPGMEALLQRQELCQDPHLGKLLTVQLVEPLQERSLRQNIPCLTPIRDDISQQVRAQYEANPYPRWHALNPQTPVPLQEYLTRLLPHLDTWSIDWPAHPQVLIAGCGTGRQTLHTARGLTGATVTSIDLSLNSLAYSQRKAQEFGMGHLTFYHADIMELGVLEQRFDVIESSGVLHHLADPIAGWRILVNMLRCGGLMRLGLYSELARQPIVAARTFIQQHGYPPTLEGIRAFRQAVMALPADDPVRILIKWSDFFTTSECRDMAFHVQEHRFTLPQLAATLQELGLEFLGFDFEITTILETYTTLFPDDPAATSLENWHAFECQFPHTFESMYQFWVRKV